MSVPAADLLALWGMGIIAFFAAWKMQVAPRLAARRTASTA